MKYFLAILTLTTSLTGCSAVKQLNSCLGSIDRQAESIAVKAEKAEALSDKAEVKMLCTSIGQDADGIREDVLRGREYLMGVKDKATLFDQTIQLMKYVGIIGLIVLFVYVGGGQIVRPFLQRFGYWISRKTRVSAEMDVKALERNSQATLRETVAARRAADAEYDAAYRAAKKKRKEEQ